jgi:hypothetical protein
MNTASSQFPKISGGSQGPIDEPCSDGSSDSWEDEDPEDEHKSAKLRQAITKGQPITIEIRADYVYQNTIHEAIFAREIRVSKPPGHILEPCQLAYKQIEQIGASYQGGLPASCTWTELGLRRDQIEITGVYLRYGFAGSSALDMVNLPEQVCVSLPLDWTLSFGTSASPRDGELTERMHYITAQLDLTSTCYQFPWHVKLERRQLRTGEEGLSAAALYKAEGTWNDDRVCEPPPLCAKEIPTYVDSTRLKETQALLRFGRNSNWPLKVPFATELTPTTTLSITYDADWSGIESTEEGEISRDWCRAQFLVRAKAEDLSVPPAFSRSGIHWDVRITKENNSIRIVLKEGNIWTPEDPGGPPPLVLFGPHAIVKIRTIVISALPELVANLGILYQGRYSIEDEVPSRE